MNFPFFTRAITPKETQLSALWPTRAHQVQSDFRHALCRFTLDCTCGAHFDTPYIDEALEWHELHERLAPLSDQLPV